MNYIIEPDWIRRGSNFVNNTLNSTVSHNENSNWGLYMRQNNIILTQNIFNLFRIGCARANLKIGGANIRNIIGCDRLLNLMLAGYINNNEQLYYLPNIDDQNITTNDVTVTINKIDIPIIPRNEIYCGASFVLGEHFNYYDLHDVLNDLSNSGGPNIAITRQNKSPHGLCTIEVLKIAYNFAKGAANNAIRGGIGSRNVSRAAGKSPSPGGIYAYYNVGFDMNFEGMKSVEAAITFLRLSNQRFNIFDLRDVLKALNNVNIDRQPHNEASQRILTETHNAIIGLIDVRDRIIVSNASGEDTIQYLENVYNIRTGVGINIIRIAISFLSGKESLSANLYGTAVVRNGVQSDLNIPPVSVNLLFNYNNNSNRLELYKNGNGSGFGVNSAIFPADNNNNSYHRENGAINGLFNQAVNPIGPQYQNHTDVRYKHTFKHLLNIANIFEKIADQIPNLNRLKNQNFLNMNLVNDIDPLKVNSTDPNANLSLTPNDFIAYIHKLIRRNNTGDIDIRNPDNNAVAYMATRITETFEEATHLIYQELGQWISNFYAISLESANDDLNVNNLSANEYNMYIVLKIARATSSSMKFITNNTLALPNIYTEMESNMKLLSKKINKLTTTLISTYKQLKNSRTNDNSDWNVQLKQIKSNNSNAIYNYIEF